MSTSLYFIRSPQDWNVLTAALLALTQQRALEVRYVGDRGEQSDDPAVLNVHAMALRGQADYALEVHWRDPPPLADDALGMCLAMALQAPVIIGDNTQSRKEWLLLNPDGAIRVIDLDSEMLNRDSVVSYSERM